MSIPLIGEIALASAIVTGARRIISLFIAASASSDYTVRSVFLQVYSSVSLQ